MDFEEYSSVFSRFLSVSLLLGNDIENGADMPNENVGKKCQKCLKCKVQIRHF